MEFNKSQIETLKTRLRVFKASKTGSQPFSFQEIVNQIILCDAAQPYLYDNLNSETDDTIDLIDETASLHAPERADKGLPMTTNIFQKWLNGELVVRGRGNQKAKIRHFTEPSNDNLMAIYLFLKEKKYIAEENLIVEDWPYAVLANDFLRYMNETTTPADRSPQDNLVTGEFYTFGNSDDIIQIRRLPVSDTNLPNVYKVDEQTKIFTKWKRKTSSSPAHINLELATHNSKLHGWGVKSLQHFCLFLKSPDNISGVHREYTLVQSPYKNSESKFEFSVVTSAPLAFPKVKNYTFTNNISNLIDKFYEILYNEGYKVIGNKIKLLRPFINLNNTLNKTLYDCVKDSENPDFSQFAELVKSGADVNERIPGDMTLLHICALHTSRGFLRELIKRSDLDYLVRDRKGYFPSMVADAVDSGSSVYRLLAAKERTSAFAQGIDWSAEQMEVLSPGWKLRTGWKPPSENAFDPSP